jgi:hypothetical protein
MGLNVEHFAFSEGLGALVPPFAEPDVLNYSSRDYGTRVGAWRMLDLFEGLKLPASVLINSALYDIARTLLRRFGSAAMRSLATAAQILNDRKPQRRS